MGKLCNILTYEKNCYEKISSGRDRVWELQLTILNGVFRVSLCERITAEQRCERDKPCSHLGKHSRLRDKASIWKHSWCVPEVAGRSVPIEWRKLGDGQKGGQSL